MGCDKIYTRSNIIELQLYLFLTIALDGDECSSLHPIHLGYLAPGEKTSRTN